MWNESEQEMLAVKESNSGDHCQTQFHTAVSGPFSCTFSLLHTPSSPLPPTPRPQPHIPFPKCSSHYWSKTKDATFHVSSVLVPLIFKTRYCVLFFCGPANHVKTTAEFALRALKFSLFIYPLTARVVGPPQMISQPVSSISPCSPLPSGTW